MKNNNKSVYRNLGFAKIDAPNGKGKNEPKSTKTERGGDMRGGKK